MKLKLTPRSKIEGKIDRVTILLYTDIETVSEKMPKILLMLVAEVGGYLGLTLGVSLLDLESLVLTFWKFCKSKRSANLNK